MKKLLLLMTLPLLALSFTACDKDDEGGNGNNGFGKLVKTVLSEEDNSSSWLVEVEYDNQQRPIKVNASSSEGSTDHRTISYGNNSITIHFIDGDYRLTLDNGFVIKDSWDGEDKSEYEYNNGQLSKITSENEDGYTKTNTYTWFNGDITKEEVVIQHDNSPIQNDVTVYTYSNKENKLNIDIFPTLWTGFSGEFLNIMKGISSKHYPVTETYNGSTTTYNYTFDNDGYPTKIVINYDGYSRTETITYY